LRGRVGGGVKRFTAFVLIGIENCIAVTC